MNKYTKNLTDPKQKFWVCVGGAWHPYAQKGGTTYGMVFWTRWYKSYQAIPAGVLRHERKHRDQWFSYGNKFIAAYASASLGSKIATGSPACLNIFEIQAGLVRGGYGRECAKWIKKYPWIAGPS